ncbi:MAG: metallopeptidase TldD-related protein [Bdellovibrionaceae bacterium]|nr:metallopeptidase TldD-related protein [Pseudobdellovibrionaceae bacterium]MDW8189864.1 metallopeptidase TldD-related protein [Pseudobdellovibrionaceae bacterium]
MAQVSIKDIQNFATQTAHQVLNAFPREYQVTLQFQGESQNYIRLNRNRIRQSTDVLQGYWSALVEQNQKTLEFHWSTSWDKEQDVHFVQSQILPQLSFLDQVDSQSKKSDSPHQGHVQSQVIESQKRPNIEDICAELEKLNVDCAGLLATGFQWASYFNSQDTCLWFAQDSHFFNYSFYTEDPLGKPRAIQNLYFNRDWNFDELSQQFADGKKQLAAYRKAARVLPKGNYRAYLSPTAMREVMTCLFFGPLSYNRYKKGDSFLHRLIDKKVTLSPKVSITHDLSKRLAPFFNSWGEIIPDQIPLIQNGELVQLLVGRKSAELYGVTSNHAPSDTDGTEYPVSLSLAPGKLEEKDILSQLNCGIWINDLHYLNVSQFDLARITGVTRFGAFWVENGQIQEPIEDFRFDVSLYDLWGDHLEDFTSRSYTFPHVDTYFARKFGEVTTPGALLKQFACVL